MGKKHKTGHKQSLNTKQPSFLQAKRDQKSEKEEADLSKKRVEKQITKEKIKESRELGLPTGIDREDIKKFNELLEKHGDKSQNKAYLESIDKRTAVVAPFDQSQIEFVKAIPKGAACNDFVSNTEIKKFPYVDFNNQSDFNPDADALEVSRKCWNWLLQPLSVDKFLTDSKYCQFPQHFKNRGAKFYDQHQEDDNLIS